MKGLFWGKDPLQENYISCKYYLLKLSQQTPFNHPLKEGVFCNNGVFATVQSSGEKEKCKHFQACLILCLNLVSLMVTPADQETETISVIQ